MNGKLVIYICVMDMNLDTIIMTYVMQFRTLHETKTPPNKPCA